MKESTLKEVKSFCGFYFHSPTAHHNYLTGIGFNMRVSMLETKLKGQIEKTINK
jgi:hypothetical protein